MDIRETVYLGVTGSKVQVVYNTSKEAELERIILENLRDLVTQGSKANTVTVSCGVLV